MHLEPEVKMEARQSRASLTFSGQHPDADAGVAELDEGQASRCPILLSDQENILGTNIPMNEVLVLLQADKTYLLTTHVSFPPFLCERSAAV